MNRFASSLIALSLAFAGSSALANQAKDRPGTQTAKPQPVQMTDAQMDNVTGGLFTVIASDLVDINNNRTAVQVPVTAAAAVAVLGVAGALAHSRSPNITQ